MHDDHLIAPPKLPVAAARQVVRSLLNAGFAEEVPAPISNPGYAWRTGEDGDVLALRATAVGIDRVSEGDEDVAASGPIGSVADDAAEQTGPQASDSPSIAAASAGNPFADEPALTEGTEEGADAPDLTLSAPTPTLPAEAPEAASKPARPPGAGLPRAAQALLAAWDGLAGGGHADVTQIIGPIAALRAALAASASAHQPFGRASPRPDTKQAQVLTMLARAEGASGPQIAEAMGWAPHTVRGFLAAVAKRGITIEVLERVRQVGPNKQGAKGSYTVYRLVDGPFLTEANIAVCARASECRGGWSARDQQS
jgi:hypothetical protein